MTRAEFEELAGIGKTSFFTLLDDPATRVALDYEPEGPGGRADMDRTKALAYIRELRKTASQRRGERAGRFGDYVVRKCPNPGCGKKIPRKAAVCTYCDRALTPVDAAPPRGRPCPECKRRITRKACICRHCGIPVTAAPAIEI